MCMPAHFIFRLEGIADFSLCTNYFFPVWSNPSKMFITLEVEDTCNSNATQKRGHVLQYESYQIVAAVLMEHPLL